MAIADVIYDNSLRINGIKVLHAYHRNVLIIAFPSYMRPDGSFAEYVYPINQEIRRGIQKTLLDQYATICGERGYDLIPAYRCGPSCVRQEVAAPPPEFPSSSSEVAQPKTSETAGTESPSKDEAQELSCRCCEHHGVTTNDLVMRLPNGEERFFVGIKRHTHYCTSTKSGRRIICDALSWTGSEWPTWCPKR